MIQASNRILINHDGASPLLFDVDHLHDRLTDSFNACGIAGSWMADDILIAVHSCLNPAQTYQSEESLDQLHASLIKILNDNGFSNVADHFSHTLRNNTSGELYNKINNELSKIGGAVTNEMPQRVYNKISGLGYPPDKVSPLLIREICLMENTPDTKHSDEDGIKPLKFMPFDSKYANWDWDILSMKAAGHLFYSVRIDIRPLLLAESLNMTTFMEMIYMEEWQTLISKAASYLQSCLLHFSEINDREIDYVSIVTHDTAELIEKCGLSPKTTFIDDLNESLRLAFGDIMQKCNDVTFEKK